MKGTCGSASSVSTNGVNVARNTSSSHTSGGVFAAAPDAVLTGTGATLKEISTPRAATRADERMSDASRSTNRTSDATTAPRGESIYRVLHGLLSSGESCVGGSDLKTIIIGCGNPKTVSTSLGKTLNS